MVLSVDVSSIVIELYCVDIVYQCLITVVQAAENVTKETAARSQSKTSQ